MFRLSLLLIPVLLLAGCANSGKNNNSDTLPDMENLMETLSRGTMGSPVTSSNGVGHEVIITSQEEFSQLWGQLHQGIGNDSEDTPEIDFDQFMVLGVFMGEMPSSGYNIRIGEVGTGEEGTTVQVHRTEPGATCMNLTVITYPHHIVKIPAKDANINFEYSTTVEECE